MKWGRFLRVAVAIGAIGALGGVTGCMVAGDASAIASADPSIQDDLQAGRHRAHRGHSPGGADASVPETGSATGPSPAAVCKVCTIAIACCEAVGGGPECTFRANTCMNLGDAARGAYANSCETFLKNIFAAWKQAPPHECL